MKRRHVTEEGEAEKEERAVPAVFALPASNLPSMAALQEASYPSYQRLQRSVPMEPALGDPLEGEGVW